MHWNEWVNNWCVPLACFSMHTFFRRVVHSVELKSRAPSRLSWTLLIPASNIIEIQPTAGNKTSTMTTQRYSRIISYLQATMLKHIHTHIKQSFPLTTHKQHTNECESIVCIPRMVLYFEFSFILIFFSCSQSFSNQSATTKPFTIVIVYLHHIFLKSQSHLKTYRTTHPPTAMHRKFQIFLFRFKLSC